MEAVQWVQDNLEIVIPVLVLAYDLVRRWVPSEKAAGALRDAAYVINVVAEILDKVVGEVSKETVAKKEEAAKKKAEAKK